MSKPDFSIVIPVYNEIDNLPELISRCLKVSRETGRPFEMIFVDDGSHDGSREFISKAAEENPEIIAIVLNRNYGQHAAVFAGMEKCRGAYIITIDADLQNPPEEIPRLLLETDKGFDVVGTVRKNRQDSFFRRKASAMVNHVVRKSTGVMMNDYGCMLRAYSHPVVQAMLQCPEKSTFIPILANCFAGSTTEIEVAHNSRQMGDSKYSLIKLISLQFDLLTSISTFPLRLLSLIGAVISVCGVGFGFMLLLLRFVYGRVWAAEGVFTLFAVLFIFIGAQFIGLGLMGEYIGRIYHDVRGRPRFFIQEILGQTGE